MLSLGTELFFAFWMASYSVGLPAGRPAGSGGHFDVLDQLREQLAALGVDDRLLVLGGGPFGVADIQSSSIIGGN